MPGPAVRENGGDDGEADSSRHGGRGPKAQGQGQVQSQGRAKGRAGGSRGGETASLHVIAEAAGGCARGVMTHRAAGIPSLWGRSFPLTVVQCPVGAHGEHGWEEGRDGGVGDPNAVQALTLAKVWFRSPSWFLLTSPSPAAAGMNLLSPPRQGPTDA